MCPLARAHWDVMRPDQLAADEQTVEKVTAVQQRILTILNHIGASTHGTIHVEYIAAGYPQVSEQSIRSRTAELVVAGKVIAYDENGSSPTGRRATRWAAA